MSLDTKADRDILILRIGGKAAVKLYVRIDTDIIPNLKATDFTNAFLAVVLQLMELDSGSDPEDMH